jgi:hypothetical protein
MAVAGMQAPVLEKALRAAHPADFAQTVYDERIDRPYAPASYTLACASG